MDQSANGQNDLTSHALGMNHNKASIEVHIGWIQQDIQVALNQIEVLDKALAQTTDASKIERLIADLSVSRQLIADLHEVIARYGDIPS